MTFIGDESEDGREIQFRLPLHLILVAIACSVMACTDSESVVSDHDWLDRQALDEVAWAVAMGLGSSEARADILKAMRASVRVQHSLLLGEHLGGSAGEHLLRDGARALGVSEDEFHGRVLALPAVLEVVVPIREHRMEWTGSAHIGVAGSWDADEREFTVYDQDGAHQRSRDSRALADYDALFHIRPQEHFGTRIGRQSDVPGPVIQDADDGERAKILTIQRSGSQARSVDFGRYATEAGLRTALAEAFGTAGGPGVRDEAADQDEECTVVVCEDDHRDGGGARGDYWGTAYTFARHWAAKCSLVGEGLWDPAEVELRMKFNKPNGVEYGTIRIEGIECADDDNWVGNQWPNDSFETTLITASMRVGGAAFWYSIVETDFLDDDELLDHTLMEQRYNARYYGNDTIQRKDYEVVPVEVILHSTLKW